MNGMNNNHTFNFFQSYEIFNGLHHIFLGIMTISARCEDVWKDTYCGQSTVRYEENINYIPYYAYNFHTPVFYLIAQDSLTKHVKYSSSTKGMERNF